MESDCVYNWKQPRFIQISMGVLINNPDWILFNESGLMCWGLLDGVFKKHWLLFSLLPALISKSDSGQDSSSPSTTPLSHAQPKPQGPPTLALAQPQLPRVPPTSSHAPQLGPPYPLLTPDVITQSITSVPPPSLLHPGLHPPPMLQNTPAVIKVREKNKQT